MSKFGGGIFIGGRHLTRYIGTNILIMLLSVAWKIVVFSSTTIETGIQSRYLRALVLR